MIDNVEDVFSRFAHFNAYFVWSEFPW